MMNNVHIATQHKNLPSVSLRKPSHGCIGLDRFTASQPATYITINLDQATQEDPTMPL